MKIYRLSVSYNYDDYHIFGDFSSEELAKKNQAEFENWLKSEIEKRPCPVTPEEYEAFKTSNFDNLWKIFNKETYNLDERYELFTQWFYGRPVFELINLSEGDYYIEEVEVDSFEEPSMIKYYKENKEL